MVSAANSRARLHFDGTMVAGGLAYAADELAREPRPATFPTGVDWIDEFSGGIAPGSVWTVAGEPGVGVTTFVTRLAVASARSGAVILANGHVPSRDLARSVLAQETAFGGADGPESAPRIASWLPLPRLGDDFWDSDCERADVVVMDTWDEMWRADRWGMSREQRIADIRWLREVARNAGTALVLTSRRARHAGCDAGAGPVHWADEALDDVADVAIELAVNEGSPGRSATVRARGRGDRVGTVRLGV
jgi:hypothetical protein